ncbi:schlafen-like protein 1 [Toxotes jaculatrix]|uniref:schlafen-like protein 1 n=1 Tax=Toxotes jaculatrix TaxID=941984 RepID=UPI001B3A893C|nr:schlafen-like protein 1 [Toxotes jaculatrix]
MTVTAVMRIITMTTMSIKVSAASVEHRREMAPIPDTPQKPQSHPVIRAAQDPTGEAEKDTLRLGNIVLLHHSCVSEQDITNCQWFHYGAHIGNETRKIEFKQGHGKVVTEDFHRQVRIYGCAFLNSGGGSLLVGVKDNGVVCGVKFSHKMEDETRLQVDRIMKQFVPPLLPNNCSLHFLPVVKPQEEGHQLKVLRLTFRPPTFSEPTLFQVGQGEVYVRWDGSVQGPLGASVILEWARQELLPSICPTPSQYFQTCFENPRPRSQASSQHQIPGSGTRFPSPSQM